MINASGITEKFKQMSLFALWREIFIGRRRIRQIEEVNQALEKNLEIIKGTSDLSLAVKHLDEMEDILARAKNLFTQFKSHPNLISEQSDPHGQRTQVIVESQLNDIIEYVSGLKLLLNIFSGKVRKREEFISKLHKVVAWLGLVSPGTIMYTSEEDIDREAWKAVIIKSPKFKAWDDMPSNIRRRHMEFKGILEQAGLKVFCQTNPSEGVTIKFMIPTTTKR